MGKRDAGQAAARPEIEMVKRGGLHFDADLAGSRIRNLDVLDANDIGSAHLMKDGRSCFSHARKGLPAQPEGRQARQRTLP
jgi:hypothetical protein